MLKKIISLAVISVFLLTSCYTINHKVGQGAQGSAKVSERQWYVLWGLVPINNVDSQQMAGGATDYTVTTEMTFVDVVIGAFTSIVTVTPMSVHVTK
jgi:hypothetical protein